jgi:PilZ domain
MTQSNDLGGDSLVPSDFQGHGIGDDRRREPRIPANKTVSIMSCDRESNAGFRQVQVFDCSLHGIGIVSSFQMNPGMQFFARLRVQDRILLCVYTSRHCDPDGEQHKVGAEFAGLVSGSEDDPNEIFKALAGDTSGT